MKAFVGVRRDPVERRIENAFQPGRFIPDRAAFSFIRELEEVSKEIEGLLESDPVRAAGLFEAFLAGCQAKAEEMDDSGASLCDFATELCRDWIVARQAAGGVPEETAFKLLAWMDRDDYCLLSNLVEEAAGVLDKAGAKALEQEMRTRFETEALPDVASKGGGPEYQHRRWAEALRTFHLRRKAVAPYISIAEQSGVTEKDCHAVAVMLHSRGKFGEALVWVEKGIHLGRKSVDGWTSNHDLSLLKRWLMAKLKRGDEALEDAWFEYQRHPNLYTYQELMKYVPMRDREIWHEKAMGAIKDGDLSSLVELFLRTGEIRRLTGLVERSSDAALEMESHYTLGPVAKKLEKSHPGLAARLWKAQGMRILNAQKSKYYDAALENLEAAMRCYGKAVLGSEWEKAIARIRAEHHRKGAFMPGFEALLVGKGPSKRPTFLEAAKARWSGTRV